MSFDEIQQILAQAARQTSHHIKLLQRLKEADNLKVYEHLQSDIEHIQQNFSQQKELEQQLTKKFHKLPDNDQLAKGFKNHLLASITRLKQKKPSERSKEPNQSQKSPKLVYSIIGNAKDEWLTELNNLVKNPIFAYVDIETATKKADKNAVVVIELTDDFAVPEKLDKNAVIEIGSVDFSALKTIILGKHTYTINENEIKRSK